MGAPYISRVLEGWHARHTAAPRLFGGVPGNCAPWCLRRQPPCYPPPPPPVEPWAVPLLTQDMSSRGHGKSISATGAHVLSLLRVQMALPWGVRLFVAPLSQGRPQEMYLICALSHQSWLLTTLLQELAPGPRASIRISPGRFDLHTLTYDSLPGCHLLHLPSAILSPGSERCPCCL